MLNTRGKKRGWPPWDLWKGLLARVESQGVKCKGQTEQLARSQPFRHQLRQWSLTERALGSQRGLLGLLVHALGRGRSLALRCKSERMLRSARREKAGSGWERWVGGALAQPSGWSCGQLGKCLCRGNTRDRPGDVDPCYLCGRSPQWPWEWMNTC